MAPFIRLNGPLHQVDLPIKFESVDGQPFGIETHFFGVFGRKQPLIGEVVDCENGRGPGEERVPLQPVAEQYRHERCLPVVAMQHVWPEVELFQDLDDTPAEEGKTPAVVGVVAFRGPVEMLTIEISPVFEQVHRYVTDGGLAKKALFGRAAGDNVDALAPFPDAEAPLLHLGVEGDDDPYIVPQPLQLLWQGTYDICQTAGFGEGSYFRGDHQYLHRE
jgi:hypothetical protein